MGHLSRHKDDYRALAHRLQAGTVALVEPESEEAVRGRDELLELLFSPEDARLAARLPVLPASLAELCRRLRLEPGELEPKLASLCDKGLVLDLVSPTTGEARYLLAPPVVGFFEFSQMRARDARPQADIARAYQAYTRDPAFAREVFGHPTVIGRALPHEATLEEEELPDVLDWERATTLLANARTVAVSHCFCRHTAEHLGRACSTPTENCLSLGVAADYVVRRKFGRAISSAEALDLLEDARSRGLVQIADNVQRQPAYVCNCCGCCCEQLRGISEFGLPAVNPSGYEPRCEEARCAGCSRCARACPVGALEMQPLRVGGRVRAELRPRVDLETCIGCGVCASACRKGAMDLRRREHPPRVPTDAVEKALRMALERGRLAHLVFDEGAGRGSRFLHRVLRALLALPPAKQALASEQLRSRFVAAALARIQDPTR